MERTVKMPTIVVTLDVSRVSGWLKSDAICAWKEGGNKKCVWGEMRVGRLKGVVRRQRKRSAQGRFRG